MSSSSTARRCSTGPRRRCPRLAAAALVLAWTAEGAALPLSATLFGVYGKTWAGGNPADPFGPGIGLHAGVTLPSSLYLEASYQLYFGVEVNESLLSDPVIRLDRTGSQNRLLGYVGYAWDLEVLTLRPSLGLGYAVETVQTERSTQGQPTTTSSSSTRGLALSPGIEARFPLGTASFCAQLRNDVLLLEGADPSALVLGLGVGLDIEP